MEIFYFHPEEIDVVGTRRPIGPEKVNELAQSIERFGLLNPIAIRVVDLEVGGQKLLLIAGAHRLEACKKLGLEKVECVVHEVDDIDAELVEISENLHRSELTQLERSEQIARWVELSEAHSAQVAPIESKRIDGRGHRSEGGVNAASRELGIERTDAQRSVKVASISERAKEAARQAGLDDNRSALLKAAKAPAEQQEAVIHSIAQAKATRTIMSEDEKRERWLNNLLRAWEAADQCARETFLQKIDQPVMDRRYKG